jgi:hypothetical protein
MLYIKNIFLSLIFILLILSCNAKDYKNNSLGLKITVPENIILWEAKTLSNKDWIDLQKTWSNKFVLTISDEPIENNDIFIRRFPNITQEGILEKLKNGTHQIFYTGAINNSYQYFKQKDKIIGEKYFYMNTAPQFSDSNFVVSANGEYYIELCFVKNNRIIFVNLTYYDTKMAIAEESLEFFKRNNNNWVYKDKNVPDKIYDLIIQKSDKAPKELVKLFEYFDEIEKSIVLN